MGTKIAFVDDCEVANPHWVGYSAVLIPAEQVCKLQKALDQDKDDHGFPRRRPSADFPKSLDEYREFKFNPGRQLWMHRGLPREQRALLAASALAHLRALGGGIILSLVEVGAATNHQTAIDWARTNLIERVKKHIERLESPHVALLVIDQEGSRNQNRGHIASTEYVLQLGTWYENNIHDYIYAAVMPAESHRHAGLQLADWVGGVAVRVAAGVDPFAQAAWADVRRSLQDCGGSHWGRSLILRAGVAHQRKRRTLLAE